MSTHGRNFGAALRRGNKIQRAQQFANPTALLGSAIRHGTDIMWLGPCPNGGKGVKHRYLGLKFKIKGKTHFGWVRLRVTPAQNVVPAGWFPFGALLTGYAYETIPGKGIIAGNTKGPDVISLPAKSPGTLGHLALGRR